MKTRRGSIRLTEQDLVKLAKDLNVKTKETTQKPVLVKSQKYNLYQPNKLESFSLSDTDFLALTTSTATIPRNMSVEGVYIELNI